MYGNTNFGQVGFAPQQMAQNQMQFYNLNEIAAQSMNFRLNFNLGQMLDGLTPQVALLVAGEVQNNARKGHPLRTNMFSYISENAFQNQQFQDLVYVILMRMGYGLQAGEWQNTTQAAQVTVINTCKAYAGGLAMHNPEFMNAVAQQDPEAAKAAQQNAALWSYLLALAQGQAPYQPFQTGPVLSNIPRSVQQNTPLSGSSGAFVEAVAPKPLAGMISPGRQSRYERMRDTVLSEKKEEQVHQHSMAPMTQSSVGFGMRSYMNQTASSDIPVQSAVGREATKSFDENLAVLRNQAASQEAQRSSETAHKPLATVILNGKTVTLVRLLSDGEKMWKRSSVQSHQPAYCRRTHTLRYFQSSEGDVIAVLQPLTVKQKEIAMNYDAHAIDPTMGQPEPNVPVNPVREEAKVLYAAADQIDVRVVIKPEASMIESFEGAIKNAGVLAARSTDKFDAMISGSIINTAVIFSEKIMADDQVHVVRAALRCKSIKEAGDVICKLDDPLMRRMIEENLTTDINNVLALELGLEGIRVSGGLKTYSDELEAALENENFGPLIAEKFASRVPSLLQANLTVMAAEDSKDYADAVLTDADQNETPVELLERTLFLQRNANITRLSYTADEMAMVIPDGRAAVLDGSTTAALVEFARTMFSSKAPIVPGQCPDNFIVTSDGVVYKIHRGLINPSSFLMSKV